MLVKNYLCRIICNIIKYTRTEDLITKRKILINISKYYFNEYVLLKMSFRWQSLYLPKQYFFCYCIIVIIFFLSTEFTYLSSKPRQQRYRLTKTVT